MSETTRREISRRRLIATFGGAAGLVTLGLLDHSVFAVSAQAAATDTGDQYDQMRAIWQNILTGGDFDPTDPDIAPIVSANDGTVKSYIDLVDRSTNGDRVFTDQPLVVEDTAAAANRVASTFSRLQAMATALRTPGSRYQDNAGVLADILGGLEILNQRVYNAVQEEFGDYWSSWYNWEMAIPLALASTCTLVYDELPADALARYLAAIDHYLPDPRYCYPPDTRHRLSAGSNRMGLCLNVALRGMVGRNEERLQTAKDALADVFEYITGEGDGFHRDGSFVQHETVAYTGGYGPDFMQRFAQILPLLAGSTWQITGTQAQFVFDAVDHSFAPVIYENQMMDFVRGRKIARYNERDHGTALYVNESILRLASAADPSTATRWRARSKGWLKRENYYDILTHSASPGRVVLFKELLADETVQPVPEPANHTLFPGMGRAVHRREGWAYGIAMASKHISYYEYLAASGENRKAFHTGDGMTYLYLSADSAQFADEFWPTVDLYRLPGSTVDSVRLADGAGDGGERPHPAAAKWVGGATIDGEFAAVGMELEALLSPLRAKKSWFCLDDYVLALGAGIRIEGSPATGSSRIETVVENRNLHESGVNALLVDGTAQPVTPGWDAQFTDPTWAHLDGVGGYVFPAGGSLRVLREERTGAWRDVGDSSSPVDPITRRYLTMWFDHGRDPDTESYAYLLVPGASRARTAELAADPDFKILANTKEIQAVRVPRLGLTAVNFWAAGSVSGIAVDAPCSLLIREGSRLSVAVADPTQELATLSVTLDRRGYKSWDGDGTISVAALDTQIAFAVDMQDALGCTQAATFCRRR